MTYPIFLLKAYSKARVVKRIRTSKMLRISRFIGTLKSNFKSYDKVYIRISYAEGEINEGIYTNFHDLHQAWVAFLEILKEYE